MEERRKTGRKMLRYLLTLATAIGLMAGMRLTAKAADSVSYIDADGTSKSCNSYTVVTADQTSWGSGWYVVTGNVDISEQIRLSDDVELILCDGATLTANKGIFGSNNSLTIYGQTDNTGKLIAKAPDLQYPSSIYPGGNVTINGGTVIATDCNYSGIRSDKVITINGGIVTATATATSNDSYGINAMKGVVINGGTVTATANNSTSDKSSYGIYAYTGETSISGGTVTATATATSEYSYGIQADNMTINGGTINATGTSYGIRNPDGNLTINGGTVTATSTSTSVANYGIQISRGSMTVDDGVVTASGYYYGIFASQGLKINGGTVTATGTMTAGVSCSYSYNLEIGSGLAVKAGITESKATDIKNDDYATIQNNYKYVHIEKAPHTHSFDYTETDSGKSITATCSADGCTLTEGKATLTLVAPTLTTYGGTGEAPATLTGLDDFNIATGKTIAVTDIKYIGRDDTTYEERATAPENAGKYTAKITVEEKTARVDYEIVKADPTATAPSATATYGQTLADVTLTNPDANTHGTWAFADPETTSVGNVGDNTFKANFTPEDTANYNSISNVDVTVTVGKAVNPATVESTATVIKGRNSVDLKDYVTLNGATGTVSYAICGEANDCELDGSVLTSGNNMGNVTVNVTVAADTNYNALAATPITVTISDKGKQTITASDVTATYGDTDKAVIATTDGNGALSYAVMDSSVDYIEVDASTGALTIKKVPANGKACVTVTAAETSTYAQTTKEVTVTINKAAPTATAPTAKTLTYTGSAQELITGGTASGGTMQYALGTDATTKPDTSDYSTSIPTAAEAGTYYVWYKIKGNENYNDSEPGNVAAKIRASISRTVTFKVVNGSWNDGTTAAKTVTLSGYEGDTLKLDASKIPAVGSKPASNYKAGSWDATPAAGTAITGNKTYTYSYTRDTSSQTKSTEKTETKSTVNTQPEPAATTVAEQQTSTVKPILNLKASQTGSKVTVKWNRISDASMYKIYGAYCGQKLKLLKTIQGNRTTKLSVTKLNGKKLKLKKHYRFQVIAYKKVDGKTKQIAKSLSVHLVGRKNRKYTNAKAVKVTKKIYSLQQGKTAKISAKIIKASKKKKLEGTNHGRRLRYVSSNKAVATVSKSGLIKAGKAGTCSIYVYAINGVNQKITVVVK